MTLQRSFLYFFVLLAFANLLHTSTSSIVEVQQPFSTEAKVKPGDSVEFIWRYQRRARLHRFFCGYFNLEQQFVILAADFNGKEFSISHQVHDAPKDDKKLLGRIKNSYAVNHGSKIAERGITLTKYTFTDAGTFECGYQKTPISGIQYEGKITVTTKYGHARPPQALEYRGQQSARDRSNKEKKKSGSFPGWAIGLSIGLPILIAIVAIAACIYKRSNKLRQSLGSDREGLMADVASSDDDEVLQYQKKVDLAAAKSK